MEEVETGNPDPPPKQQPKSPAAGGGPLAPSIAFLKAPSGILLVVNFFLLMIAFSILADWVDGHSASREDFFLFTTVFPWLVLLVMFVLLLLGIPKKLPQIPWALGMTAFCVLFAVLLLISSSLMADRSNICGGIGKCERAYGASAAFGFFSMIGLGIQAFFHFGEFRSASS